MSLILFWLLFLVAILSRIIFINPSILSLADDGAMVGLAALHWADGSDFPLMSYGQAYLGTLEAIVAALFFKLFGFNMISFSLAPLVFALAFVVVIYFFGKDLGGKRFGLLAMAFAALPAPFLVIWSIAIKGGYPEALFFGTLLLWLAWRFTQKRGSHAQMNRATIFIGMVAGVAWWCHPLSIYYLVPAFLYLLFFFFRSFSLSQFLWKGLLGIGGFLIGSLPFWIYNFQNHFRSFAGGGNFYWREMGLGIYNFFFLSIPSIFYLKPISDNLFGHIICTLLIFLFIVSLIYFTKRPLFLLFALSVLILYSTNQFGISGEPRYLLFLYSIIPFSLAWLCEKLMERRRFFGFLPLILILGSNVFVLSKQLQAHLSEAPLEQTSAQKVLDKLDLEKIDRVVSTIGPIFSVMTEERVIAAEPLNPRYPNHELLVDAADRIAIHHPAYEHNLNSTLVSAEISFESLSNPYGTLYTNFSAPSEKLIEIPSNLWEATTSLAPETAPSAFDRNLAWHWTTSALKETGQTLILDLGKMEEVRLLRIYNGFNFLQFPAGLQVEISENGKDWEMATHLDSFSFVYWEGGRPYWKGYHPRLEIRLPGKPIRFLKFVHLGESLNKIWYMNEIYLYRSAGKATPAKEEDFQNLLTFLNEKEIGFAGANRKLSAKIFLATNGKIKTSLPYNDKYPHSPNHSREIDLTKNWALIFENEESLSSELLLKEADLNFEKRILGPYTLVTGGPQKKAESLSLVWSGFSLLKNSFVPPSGALALKKPPPFQTRVLFDDKLEFLGYSVSPLPLQPGKSFQIRYYWKGLKKIERDWGIFVHFNSKGTFFQNDHAFYHGTYPVRKWQQGQIVTEIYSVQVPENITDTETEISLGLVDFSNGKKRVPITQSEVSTKSRRAFIGKLPIRTISQ